MKLLNNNTREEISLEEWKNSGCKLYVSEMTEFQCFILTGTHWKEPMSGLNCLVGEYSSYHDTAMEIEKRLEFALSVPTIDKSQLHIMKTWNTAYLITKHDLVLKKFCWSVNKYLGSFENYHIYDIILDDNTKMIEKAGPDLYFKGRA